MFAPGENDDLEEELSQWRELIGRAILGFGEIEYITYKCLRDLPTEDIFSVVAKLRFAERVDLIVKILEPSTDPNRKTLSELLRRAKTLAKDRNLVAHNPVHLSIYEHLDSGELYIEPEVFAFARNERYEKKEFVEKLVASVEGLVSELYAVVGSVFGDRGDAQPVRSTDAAGEGAGDADGTE